MDSSLILRGSLVQSTTPEATCSQQEFSLQRFRELRLNTNDSSRQYSKGGVGSGSNHMTI